GRPAPRRQQLLDRPVRLQPGSHISTAELHRRHAGQTRRAPKQAEQEVIPPAPAQAAVYLVPQLALGEEHPPAAVDCLDRLLEEPVGDPGVVAWLEREGMPARATLAPVGLAHLVLRVPPAVNALHGVVSSAT